MMKKHDQIRAVRCDSSHHEGAFVSLLYALLIKSLDISLLSKMANVCINYNITAMNRDRYI